MADKKSDHDSSISFAGLYVIIGIVAILLLIFGDKIMLFNPSYINLEYFFDKISNGFGQFMTSITDTHTWYVVGLISSSLSVFFIAIIVFSIVRMREIQNFEKSHIDHEIAVALAKDAEEASRENPRWKYVLRMVESDSESDWRLAIIEADSMMDEVLKDRGYSGDTLGDRLKNARSDAFMNIDNAWEAHNLRNKIAHEGLSVPLSQIETRRAIRLFETVLEEFGAI